jgi:transcriptional regulator with XRE-family HTH domain
MMYPYDFALHAEINRNRVYDIIIEALERAAKENGVTQAQIAQTIGRKPSQVSAWLSGPSNWTLDTISDLVRAVGASMDYKVVFDDDRVASNIMHPALTEPILPSITVSSTGPNIVEGTKTWLISPHQTSQYYKTFPVSGTPNIETYTVTQLPSR